MSRKSCPFAYNKNTIKIGQDFSGTRLTVKESEVWRGPESISFYLNLCKRRYTEQPNTVKRYISTFAARSIIIGEYLKKKKTYIK